MEDRNEFGKARTRSLDAKKWRKMLPNFDSFGIENFVSEIEEDFLDDPMEEGKKIYSLSKFSQMFN